MKKYAAVAVLIAALLLIVSSVSAALPGSGWWTSFSVQNVGAGDGSVQMTAYSATDTIGSEPFPISPFNSLIYDPGRSVGGNSIGFSSSLPSGFEGSVVLSGSVPLAAAAEIANYTNGSVGGGGTASAQYQAMGADITATELLVPTVKHNYGGIMKQTTTIYVQAAGADAEVTVTYNMNDGSTHTQTKTISANQMFVFDPANAEPPVAESNCGTDANASPCFGAATISSTANIAATYVEHPHQGSPAPFALSTRAQTVADQSTTLYGASVKHEYTTGAGTGITGDTIMNVGTGPALVRATLTVTKLGNNAPAGVSVGDVFIGEEVIQPGQSVVFSQWDNNLGGMPAGTFAAVTYESIDNATYDPQPLVGASNDAKTLPKLTGGLGKTVYKLFADTTTTDTVAAPIIKEFVNNITGALTVQNVGTNPDKIVFEFYEFGSSTGPYVFETKDALQPGEAINTWGVSQNYGNYLTGLADFSVLNGKEFSVKVYSKSGEPIICLVSENSPPGDYDIRNYEGFNITSP